MRGILHVFLLAGLFACGGEGRPAAAQGSTSLPTVSLESLPASTTTIVSADVRRVAAAPWLVKAVKLLAGDAAPPVGELLGRCKLDPATDLDSLVLGLTATDAVVIVRGKIAPAAVAACLGEQLKAVRATVTSEAVGPRSVYAAAGPRPLFYSFAEGALVAATSRALLDETFAAGKKAALDPRMLILLGRVDRTAAVWGAGQLGPDGAAVAGALGVSGAAATIAGSLDLAPGAAKAAISIELAAEADAARVAKDITADLGWLAVSAQRWGVGRVVGALRAESVGPILWLRGSLGEEETRVIDGALDERLKLGNSARP